MLPLFGPSLYTNFYNILYFLEYCIRIKICVVFSLICSVVGKYLCKPNTLRDEADIDTFHVA